MHVYRHIFLIFLEVSSWKIRSIFCTVGHKIVGAQLLIKKSCTLQVAEYVELGVRAPVWSSVFVFYTGNLLGFF